MDAVDRELGAHLLRRFAFGATDAALDEYLAGGYEKAVDRLLAYETVQEPFPLAIEDLKTGKNDRVTMAGVVAYWTARLMTTRRPLQEKMTVFWHNHFATSAAKVGAPLLMAQQIDTLRQNATGSFRTLLLQASQDPAMLYWLDNQQNVKGKPNENFAREVMELFTLGIGNYTEDDVKAAARAFTGWSARRTPDPDKGGVTASFLPRPALHDDGDKTFLGKTGNLSGEDVLGALCDHPQCAEFITEKVLRWFVRPDPSKATVRKFASVFRDANLEVKPLLRAIMLSPEFRDSRRTVVKSPVDFVIPTLRQTGSAEKMTLLLQRQDLEVRRRLGPAAVAAQAMRAMGMGLLYPPDVSGWRIGQAWLSSSTMVERMRWAEKLFGNPAVVSSVVYETAPAAIADAITSILDAPMPKAKRSILARAAEEGLRTSPSAAAIAVGRLIFASPEFQAM